MFDSAFSIAREKLSGLYEIVDNDNKTICFLSKKEMLAQKLPHRTMALLIHAKKRMLLRQNVSGFGFSSFELIPAGWSAGEFAEELLRNHWRIDAVPRHICDEPPCAENNNSFCSIYAINIADAFIQCLAHYPDEFLLVDPVEFNALAERGYPVSPFLTRLLRQHTAKFFKIHP